VKNYKDHKPELEDLGGLHEAWNLSADHFGFQVNIFVGYNMST